jgi:hypothetical protein
MDRDEAIDFLTEKVEQLSPEELNRALEELDLSPQEEPEDTAEAIYWALAENGIHLAAWLESMTEENRKELILMELLLAAKREPTLD